MTELFQFVHFLGAAILVGGELLVAMIAIRAQGNDQALGFFVGFLGRIAAYLWVGVGLALIGGVGLTAVGDRAIAGALALKLIAFALIIVISVFLGMRIPRVREAAERGLEDVRRDPSFRMMDLLSRANLGLVLAVLLISILM